MNKNNTLRVLLISFATFFIWMFIDPSANPELVFESRMAEALGGTIVILALGFGAAYVTARLIKSKSGKWPDWGIRISIPYIALIILAVIVGSNQNPELANRDEPQHDQIIRSASSSYQSVQNQPDRCEEALNEALAIMTSMRVRTEIPDFEAPRYQIQRVLQNNLNALIAMDREIGVLAAHCRHDAEQLEKFRNIRNMVAGMAQMQRDTARRAGVTLQ